MNFCSESLFNRCLSSILVDIKEKRVSADQLSQLPTNLRRIFLGILTKRGLVNDALLDALLSEQTKILELSECYMIDESTLIRKIAKCKYLMKLDLNGHREPRTTITSAAFCNLVASCKYLQILLLRRCVLIDDACIELAAISCLKLAHLNIGNCPLITDRSILALGRNCANLKSINLTGTQVTDNGIVALMSESVSQTIEEVHLAQCDAITDESIECILTRSKRIKYLLFHGCPKTTDASRLALEDYMQNSSNKPMKHLTWTIY